MITASRWLRAVLAAAVAVSACACGTSDADGRRIASQSRRPVADTFWGLYRSLGSSVIASGGNGRFTQCGNGAGHSVVYAVRMVIAPRGGASSDGQFLAEIAGQLKRAGWQLSQAGSSYQVTSDSGVRVAVAPRLGGSRTTASITVTGRCAYVGAAADPIVTRYQNNSDRYRAAQAAAAPVPTGFPGR